MPSSGNLLADRRYAWAEAALKEADTEAAADLAEQTLELAPDFAAAWLLLGQARIAACPGELDEAQRRAALEAFRTAARLDPDDALGAQVWAAQLGDGDATAAMSPAYVRALYDDYAVRFERHLVQSLGYRGPALLHHAVARACSLRQRAFRFAQALDLGCGTGLTGEAFRPECQHLAGVDLSPAMAKRAARKRVYDELSVGDATAWLGERPERSADLALAADVFIYIPNLALVFAQVSRVLRRDGLFAFTVQTHAGDGVVLGEDARYAHARTVIRHEAEQAGFATVLLDEASIRQERGEDVPGLIAVLAR